MKEKDSRAQFNMPFGLENQNGKGTVKLHEGVIASVVKNATCSENGIVRFAGSSLLDSIAGLLGTKKKTTDSAIKIKLTDESASVDVNIIVAYGENIPALALQLQTTIINEVKKIAGITVSQVNVYVRGVEEVIEETVEESEEAE
jgi:uncharacterized alkaline shock family protein YloU